MSFLYVENPVQDEDEEPAVIVKHNFNHEPSRYMKKKKCCHDSKQIIIS